MKKTVLIVALVVLALGVVGVGAALAQGGQPPFGSMTLASDAHLPRVQVPGSAGVGGGGYGPMHEYVEQALAAKLGLTETQVEDQVAAGKPMYQIALDNGIQQEDLADFMNGVHQDAFAEAVKDGVMTQEQADWMLKRMQNMYQNGYGAGNCPMHNGQGGQFGRGNGFGPGMMQKRGGGYGPGMPFRQGTQNP